MEPELPVWARSEEEADPAAGPASKSIDRVKVDIPYSARVYGAAAVQASFEYLRTQALMWNLVAAHLQEAVTLTRSMALDDRRYQYVLLAELVGHNKKATDYFRDLAHSGVSVSYGLAAGLTEIAAAFAADLDTGVEVLGSLIPE